MKFTPISVRLMRKAWAKNDAVRDAGLTEPDNIVKYKNIEYSGGNLLDLYRPDEDSLCPVIVDIHGGGYFYGDKELYRFYCMMLATKGFAVVNYNYRLSPENKFPAPLEDTNEVFVWVEENAAKYHLDLNNVFLMGDSAGAQLASQYGAINTNEAYAKLFNIRKHNIKVKGLLLACGLYDLYKKAEDPNSKTLMNNYVGKKYDIASDPKADVLGNITADYPPTFLFTSENDFLHDECKPMYDLLISKGIKAKMHVFGTKEQKEIGHVFHLDFRYDEGTKANAMQIEFINELINQ